MYCMGTAQPWVTLGVTLVALHVYGVSLNLTKPQKRQLIDGWMDCLIGKRQDHVQAGRGPVRSGDLGRHVRPRQRQVRVPAEGARHGHRTAQPVLRRHRPGAAVAAADPPRPAGGRRRPDGRVGLLQRRRQSRSRPQVT